MATVGIKGLTAYWAHSYAYSRVLHTYCDTLAAETLTYYISNISWTI